MTGIFNFTDRYAFHQGDTWRWSFRYLISRSPDIGRDLTGLAIKMQIRKREKFDGDLLVTLPLAVEPLTGITLGDQTSSFSRGVMSFLVASADTASFPTGIMFYDVQIVDGTEIETFIKGEFEVQPQVTT